ncbi:acetyl-CoA decarbonylase/synthase complex subunit gamma [Candidatus Poribacteria bacterium]|nr:MAG: acetyl-CoA decarbonylase/synthase complex subunit gamma [Candidatus Poribacteria bacterium]
MAVNAIEIYKKLPKTNCKDCGFPTCLAFAMNVAAGKVELEKCPHISEEAKAELAEASAPPMRTVEIGTGENALKVGGETVLFRHEKTFVNPPGIAILITDEMDESEVDKRLSKLKELQYERVGLTLKADMVALKCSSGDPERFASLVRKVVGSDGYPLILISEKPDVIASALEICADRKPLIYPATPENYEEMGKLAQEKGCPLGVKAESVEELADVTSKLMEMGLKDLVIDSGARDLRRALWDQVIIRRAAILNRFRPLGFPTIAFPCEMTDDPIKEALIAATLIAKYAGILVLSDFEGHVLFPLLVERLNIYTDPQRPMSVTEGIYEIGRPDENSPVLITTNFSLTYFIVSGEIENSRMPAYLLVKDTEGLSVLTAWAADKFVAETIAPFVKKCGIEEKVKHRKIIIPGYVARIAGELEDELGDWEVLVGPREASNIPAYLREVWK